MSVILNGVIQDILDELAAEIVEIVKSYIDMELYSRPESKIYDRTGDFLRAVTSSSVKKTGGTYSVEIFLDPAKIPPKKAFGDDRLNSRMTIDGETAINGREISTMLNEWIEEGNSLTDIKGSPKAVHMWENTGKELDNSFGTMVLEAFSKHGIKVNK